MPLSQKSKTNLTLLFILALFCVTAVYGGMEFYSKNREALSSKLRISLPSLGTIPGIQNTFRLGLDLKGGTHLVYNTDLSKIPVSDRTSSVDGVRDVIERRVNAFGVSEPVVQTVKVGDTYRVIVELAGVHDVSQAIKLIGDTPLLEFKEQDAGGQQKQELTPELKKQLDDFNAAAQKKTQDLLARIAKGEDFSALAKQYSDEDTTKTTGGDLGWITDKSPRGELVFPASKLKPGETTKELFSTPQGNEIVKLIAVRESEKQIAASHILICYEGATRCERTISKDDAKKQIEDLKSRVTPQNFAQLAKENSSDSSASSGGDLGWVGKGMMVKGFEDTLFKLKKGEVSGVTETEFGFHIIYNRDEKPLKEYHAAHILVRTKTAADYLPPADPWKETGLTGKQLKKAYVEIDSQTRLPTVGIEFNDEGKKLFGELTTRNVNKPIAIFLDNILMSAPNVKQSITDGRAVITGNFTNEEAKTMVQRLNSGALPVPISLASQQTVGATLGAESLHKSLTAGLYGFLLVALFMIFFYRLPGLIAVIALCIYTALTLAIFKIWPVTLSLAGIAGFILSIGMAVDANILIFERVKEELRWGRTLDGAIANGFKRAWTSIRDSNASSLITSGILFWFSASLIKGFALTLAIGIAVSMFSAIFITRVALRFVAQFPVFRNPWLFSGKKPGDQSSSK